MRYERCSKMGETGEELEVLYSCRTYGARLTLLYYLLIVSKQTFKFPYRFFNDAENQLELDVYILT